MYTPDKIDMKILAVLQENANLKIKELSAAVGLSVTPVFERLKRLEKEKIINLVSFFYQIQMQHGMAQIYLLITHIKILGWFKM